MLFGSSSLEVLIGVVLLFLVLAVIASAVAEIVAQVLALRSRTLHDATSTMLFHEKARTRSYEHPLIESLSQRGRVDKNVVNLRGAGAPPKPPTDADAATLAKSP